MMEKQKEESSIDKLLTPFEEASNNAAIFIQNMYVFSLFQKAIKELTIMDRENQVMLYDPDVDAKEALSQYTKTEQKWATILSEKTLTNTSCWAQA